MLRPRAAIRQEVFDVLDAQLSTPVVVQRQPKDAGAPLVMIEPPAIDPRGDIKRHTGHSFTQRIRVHTRYPKGRADISRREEIAGTVIGKLEAATLDPVDHRIVDWPDDPDTTPQTYEASGGEQAYDLLLDYDLHTQIKATI
jgi:hypothetical protein